MNERLLRLRRMQRYWLWREYLIEQWKLRTRNAVDKRLGRGYAMLAKPDHYYRIKP